MGKDRHTEPGLGQRLNRIQPDHQGVDHDRVSAGVDRRPCLVQQPNRAVGHVGNVPGTLTGFLGHAVQPFAIRA